MDGEITEKSQEQGQYAAPPSEPVDLAQAFRMLKPNDNEGTENPVGMSEGDTAEGAVSVNPDIGTGMEGADGDGIDGDLGGSSAVIEPVDYDGIRRKELTDVQRQALLDIRKEFNDNNISTYNINELYQRDEQTGRVTFVNPDNEREPFTSRAEAQQWIDAINKQVNNEFRNRVNERQRELLQERMPRFQLIEFIPKYDAMSQVEKDIFDELVEPYSVTDQRGEVIGFSANLDALANQARRLASKFNTVNQAPQDSKKNEQVKEPDQPALDMPTGSGKSNDSFEPKSLGEALKYFDKQKNQKKGKQQ